MDPNVMYFDALTSTFFIATPFQMELAQKKLNDILKYSENGEATLDDYCDVLGIGKNKTFGRVVLADRGKYRKIVFAKSKAETENGEVIKIEIKKPGEV